MNQRISRWTGMSMLAGIALLLQACGSGSAPASAPTAVSVAAPAATPMPAPTEVPLASPSPEPATAEPQIAATPTAEARQDMQPALQMIADGLESPTYLTHAGDGSGVLYITEQPGRVRVWRDGQVLPTPFLDLTDRVGDRANEQGLLSIAFSPDFAQSRRLFVNYTDTAGDTVISGFIANADGLTADPSSEWVVMRIAQPYANHNGGQIKFGPDGMLYIGMGDGGAAGDPQNFAQNMRSLLGKMLRIDVSQSSPAQPYRVPADNPDFGDGARPEIWASGLRNPWRFSFDRVTGDMFIADVGQNAFEEINFQPANQGGQNYGWKFREGFAPYAGDPGTLVLTDPIHQYAHREGGCSVTGGYVYRGSALPSLAGAYIYGDFCSGLIWTLRPDGNGGWQNDILFRTPYNISSFGEDEAGELYVLDRNGGVYKLVGVPAS
ncbi:MAG: PQQ-dependent sugar dehydrogenase [Anaerolineae bacterium]|nr:PQQ-dependent sugar dehydrogenase [Candidatus Roseilinea sp.]MDW8449561.1 PQQ-dependent sugar dehydrogenase [Anaerolineae bacterium]